MLIFVLSFILVRAQSFRNTPPRFLFAYPDGRRNNHRSGHPHHHKTAAKKPRRPEPFFLKCRFHHASVAGRERHASSLVRTMFRQTFPNPDPKRHVFNTPAQALPGIARRERTTFLSP